MTAFHEIMSKTFHPVEEGKFEPIKTQIGEMVKKATAWKKSTAPEGYNMKQIKGDLKALVKGAKGLEKIIKSNAADNVIKEKLTALHDVFHTIVGKCTGEDHK
jgi:FMN phosphatase YigB (HAD superfamily)